jgi:RNA polymerase sigma-70 factor (ECF subfamily)
LEPTADEITQMLKAWNSGDDAALQSLIPAVYKQLHQSARSHMARERPGHVLQTSALVNEVYVRLVGVERINWKNRAHFLAVCAQMMRQILVDLARERCAQKRGGDARHVPLNEDGLFRSGYPNTQLLALDDALKALADADRRKSRVVELRFFGGLDVAETAEVLGVSPVTVQRDWKLAKAWLFRELSGGKPHAK